MSDQKKSLHEMHAMLKTAELDMKDTSRDDVLFVQKNKQKFKKNVKGKGQIQPRGNG